MPRIGCLTLLLPCVALLAVLGLEVWVFIRVCHWFHDWLAPAAVVVVSMVLGWRLLMATMRVAPMALLSGNTGRLVVRGIAGLALLFPGLCTTALGLLLLVPVFDRLFKRLGDKVVAAVMRHAMGRMMGGKGGGFSMFGGFQVGGAGRPPGPPPMTPDDHRPLPGSPPKGRIIDTTAERDDKA